MFSMKEKQKISQAVENALLEIGHPEMPKEKPKFELRVYGKESWSLADIAPIWKYDNAQPTPLQLKLITYKSLCSTREFEVNGVLADNDDFGNLYDNAPDEAEDYGCGDRVFKPKESTTKVLEKYKITQEEYDLIAQQLEEALSFGQCSWCV